MAALREPLVWIDLEMTGLDPACDVILEIAVVITDGDLATVVEGPDLVISQPESALESLQPVVRGMHTASGLLDAVRESSTDVVTAEKAAVEFIRQHVPEPGTAPLAGNSVHADRAFLQRYMPDLASVLHYRNVDVSTIKELARRWHPQALEHAPEKAGGHRALADILESVAELRYYRQALFRLPEPGVSGSS